MPPETSSEEELSISLQENHVREKEDFDDTLARVEKRAKQLGCSFKKAAELEQVNPAYVSRAKKIVDRVDPKVLELAKAKGVGLSVLYEVASTDDSKLQRKLIESYVAGSMNREAIAQAVKKKPAPAAKKVTIDRVTETATLKMVVLVTATYEQLFEQLAELKKQLASSKKNGIPVKLLPEVMKGGRTDVVRKA